MVLLRVFGLPGLVLLWIAGADRDRVTTKPERARYIGYGTMVVVTTVFAFVSMATALAYALHAGPAVYLPVASVYALAVFTFDRFVTAHVSDETGWRRIKAYLPRIAIAVVIGIVVAEPLVLRLYEPEIDAKIATLQRDAELAIAKSVRGESNLAAERKTLETRRKRNDAQLASANARVDKALTAFDRETAGTGGTRIPGYGRVAIARESELGRATAARDAVKRRVEADNAAVASALARWEGTVREEIATQGTKVRAGNGFLAREHALNALMDDYPDLRWRRWILTVLLILLDCLVVAFKALWPPSDHDRSFASERRVANAQRAAIERYETEMAEHREQVRTAADKERIARLAEARARVEGAAVEKWVNDQLERIATGRPDIEVIPPFAWPSMTEEASGAPRNNVRPRERKIGNVAGRRSRRHRAPVRAPFRIGTIVKIVINGLRAPIRISPRWTLALTALIAFASPRLPAAPAASRVLATAVVTSTTASRVTVPGLVSVTLPRDAVTGSGTLRIVESNVYVPRGIGRPVTIEIEGTRLTMPLPVDVEVPDHKPSRPPRLLSYDAAKQEWTVLRAEWDGRVLRGKIVEAGVPIMAVP